jgi:CheY-like chemotaxis protein
MPTILLVEDDPLNQAVMKDLFRYDKLPGELICVGSAEEALRILPSLNPVLVLMDVMLPGMSGIEATRIIRKREQEEHRPPVYILAMTASIMQDDRERCLAAGMDGYLSKPVRRNQLAEILRECCPGDRPENEPAAVTREPVVEKPMIEEPLRICPRMTCGAGVSPASGDCTEFCVTGFQPVASHGQDGRATSFDTEFGTAPASAAGTAAPHNSKAIFGQPLT